MAKYQPPDKQANRKRNKTGYNMFFSAHVLRLKQSDAGVPSERGSVARLVGNAWKQLASEEKQYYEREADKMNGMNPVDKDDEEDDGDDKRPPMPEYPANYPPPHGDMHVHPGMPPPMHMELSMIQDTVTTTLRTTLIRNHHTTDITSQLLSLLASTVVITRPVVTTSILRLTRLMIRGECKILIYEGKSAARELHLGVENEHFCCGQ
jgi:HMG-box domain